MRYTHEKRFSVEGSQECIAVINRTQSTNRTRTQQVKHLQLGDALRDELRDELHYNVIIDHIKPSTLASQRAQSIYQFLLSQDLSSKRLKLLKLKEVEVQENNWV